MGVERPDQAGEKTGGGEIDKFVFGGTEAQRLCGQLILPDGLEREPDFGIHHEEGQSKDNDCQNQKQIVIGEEFCP